LYLLKKLDRFEKKSGMRLGLIGDIHGNSAALQATLNSMLNCKIKKILVTGDMIGYYFNPKAVIELLFERPCVYVKGNHEQMLKRSRHNPGELDSIESKYGCGLRLALETLSQSQLDWIESIPINVSLNIGGCKILLCHGTPSNNESYIYPDAPQEMLAEYSSLPYDFVIMGHTHYPMNIKAGTVRLVNPGSVGQPRTKGKDASWASLDTKTGEVEFFSATYDATSLIKECKKRHPEIPYLAEVLLQK